MTDELKNVVVLPGHKAPTSLGEPNAEIVKLLETFLENAKRGDLAAVAFAAVCRDSNPNLQPFLQTGFECEPGTQYALDSALSRLRWRWDSYRNKE